MAQKIFIDTDCGIDDAVAIMLALSSPEVEITGISCVAGNTSLENVVKNVCGLLSFYNRTDIPVFRGCSSSLLDTKLRADDVHGGNGLGGVDLAPVGKRPETANAAEGIFKAAADNPGLKLVTLGPLTNVAVAFNLYPRLSELISEIVMMGGAIGPGNVTPYAEFNFAYDPESIAYCLGLDVPTRILTWDATIEMTLTEEEYLDFDMGGTPPGDLFIDIQRFYIDYKERMFGSRVISFPDPLAMACVIDPEIVEESEDMALNIVLNQDDKKRGASVRSASSITSDGNADVIMKCRRERFEKLIMRIKEFAIE